MLTVIVYEPISALEVGLNCIADPDTERVMKVADGEHVKVVVIASNSASVAEGRV